MLTFGALDSGSRIIHSRLRIEALQLCIRPSGKTTSTDSACIQAIASNKLLKAFENVLLPIEELLMNKMGLVLQGGGALGAYEYGAVTRLIELRWQPVVVTGVSIGAINAAAAIAVPETETSARA